MRPVVAACCLLLVCASVVGAAPFSVLFKVGLKDAAPTAWQGTVSATGATLTAVTGWRFRTGDSVGQGNAYQLRTDERLNGQGKLLGTLPKGLLVTGDTQGGARLTFTANSVTWEVSVADLTWGEARVHPSGDLSAQLAPAYTTLSGPTREDDYPAACTLPGDTTVAVWQSYADNEDQLLWSICRQGRWEPARQVPGLTGDLYRPGCASDGKGGFWVVCPRQERSDFDLWATHWDGTNWSAPQKLTDQPGNDFDLALATDAAGTLYCTWQAFRGGSSDILLATCTGGVWSKPLVVANSSANEWMPSIAATAKGAWIAWDTYQNGSYDVYAAEMRDGKLEAPLPIAATDRFEAKASVAVDKLGRVWFAWQEAGSGWGKDTGYTVPTALRREAIYRERSTKVACLSTGRLQYAPDVSLAMPQGERANLEEPRLSCDGQGRLWLVLRHPMRINAFRGNKMRAEIAWEDYATYLDGEAWAPVMYFPDKLARIDTFPALAPSSEGLTVVFHTDGRDLERLRGMTRNQVFATVLSTSQPVREPQLVDAEPPAPVSVNVQEAADVQRARSFLVNLGDRAYRLLRGDLHRHTEVSWDGNGDGSVLDCYRYAMDAASLDFLMVSDHNQDTGVDLEYIRWRCYKVADVYNNPPRFSTLYGYERSLGFPNGHRNIINTQRFHPSFPFTRGATRGVAPDDLQQLYEYCRREGAVVIPHTSGSNHGTNWPTYDLGLEPVVEIFQGCRNSYEYEGCPKGDTPGSPQSQNTGYQPEGFVWRAWKRTLDLGIICSSDHGSTHYSYAGVYCETPSREGIYAGIQARRTFGANDNLIVSMRCGDHFMGESWKQTQAPALDIEVLGTAPIVQIDLIRDFKFAYTAKPNQPSFKAQWLDNDFTPGTHLYYVRAIQADESIAWGSPVWITRG